MESKNRILLIALGALVFIALISSTLVGGMMGPGMMGPGMMGRFGVEGTLPGTSGWGWGMALGWLMMLAFWGVLIVGAVVLLRWLGTNPTRPNSTDRETPDDILQRRYAAGEITAEEYEHMREALGI